MTAVVITGASTGIGAATAEFLAQRGERVFAGVRDDDSARRLAEVHANVTPLRLDVTDANSIARAAAQVRAAGIPLRGVVNNAGIAVAGPLEFLPVPELREQFAVNVIGPLAVMQAFLPLVRAAHGRLVFIGSISGRFAVPFIAPYSASKFALRALTDALRIELSPQGIPVALIEPGSVKTPIWRKGRELYARAWDALPPEAAIYAAELEAVVRQTQREERGGIAPVRVSRAIEHTLFAPHPRAHYIIGTPARMAGILVSLLPPRVHDRFIRKAMGLP